MRMTVNTNLETEEALAAVQEYLRAAGQTGSIAAAFRYAATYTARSLASKKKTGSGLSLS